MKQKHKTDFTITPTFKFKLLSIVIGLFCGLLITEIGIRVYKYMIFNNLDDIEFGNRSPINEPEQDFTLGQIIQISSFEKIIYELIPNSKYQFKNVLVETNDDGFRDKNYPKLKSKNTKRIIGIGDSGMFGWGVEGNQSYLSELENQLNKIGSSNFEVMNTSVPGYNTMMEVAVLENKIKLDQVDLVIIDFIDNDFELPSFIRKRPNFWTLKKSFILLFFEENFIEKHRKRDKWLSVAPDDGKGYFESDPNKVPKKYQNMVGQKSYANAMKKLKRLSEEYGFQILAMSQSPFLDVPEIVTSTCKELGIEFLDFRNHWEKIKLNNPSIQWKLSEHDWHPTPEAHQEISKVLFEKIKELDF